MINGILNIYKEKGYTSHDVVARLRRIAGQKKIGHTGTLDPDAEGVLPVCLGRATKVCDMLTDRDKTYKAVLLLGRTTDTQDISGTVLSECSTEDLEPEKVEECILGFAGEYDQIPPMYSALKVNGRKLYELAREGKTVERKSRRVVIRSIRILAAQKPYPFLFRAQAYKVARDKAFELISRTDSKGPSVSFYFIEGSGERLSELLMLSDGDEEFIVLDICGVFDVRDISRLTQLGITSPAADGKP